MTSSMPGVNETNRYGPAPMGAVLDPSSPTFSTYFLGTIPRPAPARAAATGAPALALARASWIGYTTMEGVMMASLSAASNHLGASEMCTPHVTWPSGAAQAGAATASTATAAIRTQAARRR